MKKLYVFVRRDLSRSQQAVQGAHAVAEFLLKNDWRKHKWDNGTIVMIGVKNITELWYQVEVILHNNGIYWTEFHELDLGDSLHNLTALATVLEPHQQELFKDFRLL